MTSENEDLRQDAEWAESQLVSRSGWRFTVNERKTLLLGMDLLLVNGMLLLAVIWWNGFVPSLASLWDHNKWFLTISALWLIVGTVLDIYNLARVVSKTNIITNIGMAAILTTLLYLAVPWFSPPVERRVYVVSLVFMVTGALIAWRIFYARVLVHTVIFSRGLVVGSNASALALADVINQMAQGDAANSSSHMGYEIVGRVVDAAPATTSADVPVLGDMLNLVRLARQHAVHEIILAPETGHSLPPEVLEILLDCRELGLQVSSLSSVYERLTGRLLVDYARYDLQLLLSPEDSPTFRLHRAVKRTVDVLLALVGVLLFGLVLLPFIILGNALISPGPLFYRQERMGKGGRPFTLIKLRSMSQNAERSSGGAVWSKDNDPRITPMGRFLRKIRLDEVPQLINVLRGEMSMVGPRPERPHFVGQLARTFPLYRARHTVKPGITGWAQVNYEYGNSVEDARIKLEYDLYYVKHVSLYFDFLILLHTIRVVVGQKGQ